MNKKTLFVSIMAIALSTAGSEVFAKGKRGSKKPSRSSQVSKPPASKKSTSKEDKADTANNKKADSAESTGNKGMSPMAAGLGGAVIGGLAGAAIASSFAGDTAAPSPLLDMTPEEALKSASDMQTEASDAGFGFRKADSMLRKAQELLGQGDTGKKQAQEIAIIVHTWANAGVKQSEELKKASEQLGLSTK